MVGKLTLHLLGTVLLFIVGIFNFYKEDITITQSHGSKEISLMNDETNMDFKEQLKITIEYFERLLNHDKCNESYSSTGGKVSNFDKILMFTSESAVDIYLYNRLHNYTADNLIPSRIEVVKNAMPTECETQSETLKEVYQNISEFLNFYYTNFPSKSNCIEYNTCYVVSLLEFAKLEELINSDINLSTNLEVPKKCIPLKSQKKNSTAKYFSKKIPSTNSTLVTNHLHDEDVKFRKRLEIVINFFKIVLDNCKLTKLPEKFNPNTEEWKILSMIWFISYSAKDIYSFHNNSTIRVEENLPYYATFFIPLISRECDAQLKANEELIQNLYQFFNMYYKNYPTQFINDEYSKCFVKSIKNIIEIDYNKLLIFPDYDKKSVNDIITKKLVSIMKCVELKEHL